MSHSNLARVRPLFIVSSALLAIVTAWSPVRAEKRIDERHAADPRGTVEISDVAGSIEIRGWDRPEVLVDGTTDDGVERVELNVDGSHTSVRVVLPHGIHLRGGAEAHLVVHVPATSSVAATLVSALLKVSGVQGDAKLQTVSGAISGDVGGDLRATSISGSVRMTAHGARSTGISTVSGGVGLIGGGGELEITTISGAADIEADTLTRVRLKTASGKLSAKLALATDGQLDAESVSGAIALNFKVPPAADFDVHTLSGGIDNCFGPKPERSQYGAGSRLVFKSGAGGARVHVETLSGTVDLCTPH